MKGDAQPVVKFARAIVLEGKLKKGQLEEIKSYCVNPVDSQDRSKRKAGNAGYGDDSSGRCSHHRRLSRLRAGQLEGYRREMGFAMSPEDIKFVQGYYKDTEHRDPTLTELKVIDTYWSDHCRTHHL